MYNLFEIPILGNKTFITKDKEIYNDGLKICNNLQDFGILKLTLKKFSKYLDQNKNLNEEISYNFNVSIIDKEVTYTNFTIDSQIIRKINFNFKIVQKDSKKSLRININNKTYFISKI